jgi:hypothetical protein
MILIIIIIWAIRGFINCFCSGVLDVFEENIEPVEEVQVVNVNMENIAGEEVVIEGFI